MPRHGSPKDLTGQTFASLTVIRRASENTKAGKAKWHCRCACGGESIVIGSNLINGNTNTCGRGIGCRFSGFSKESEFRVWHHMKQRCHNPNDTGYADYGGRGIKVCERWRESYHAFIADMGRRPFPKAQLDRINNEGDYEPSNCEWVTAKKNCRHTTRTRWVTYRGEKRALSEWCELLGKSYPMVLKRLNTGRSSEQAFR